MNKVEFEAMIERLRKDEKHFNVLEVECTGEEDYVIFEYTAFIREEMDLVIRTLKIHRFPEWYTDGEPLPVQVAGKIVINEKVICPTCKHESWKNVTKEFGDTFSR